MAVARLVEQAHGVGLDGDPALALQVHRVEHLVDGLLGVHRPGERQEPVGQGGLAVVDVRDDGEVADRLDGHRAQYSTPLHGRSPRPAASGSPSRAGHDGAGARTTRAPSAPAPIARPRRRCSRAAPRPAPTSTRSQRMAPSTAAPRADHAAGRRARWPGPRAAPAASAAPAPITAGRRHARVGRQRARPVPPSAAAVPRPAGASGVRDAPGEEVELRPARYAAGLPMSSQ